MRFVFCNFRKPIIPIASDFANGSSDKSISFAYLPNWFNNLEFIFLLYLIAFTIYDSTPSSLAARKIAQNAEMQKQNFSQLKRSTSR